MAPAPTNTAAIRLTTISTTSTTKLVTTTTTRKIISITTTTTQPRITTTQPSVVTTTTKQQNTILYISQCQAQRDANYSSYIEKLDNQIEQTKIKIRADARDYIQQQLQSYDICYAQTPLYPDIKCGFYLDNAEMRKKVSEQYVEKAEVSRNSYLIKGREIVDKEYQECLDNFSR